MSYGAKISKYLKYMGRKLRSPQGPQLDELWKNSKKHDPVPESEWTARPTQPPQRLWRDAEDGDDEVNVGATSTALNSISPEHRELLVQQYGEAGASWQKLSQPQENDTSAQKKIKQIYAQHAEFGALYKFTPSGKKALDELLKKERGAKLKVSEDKKLQNAVTMPAEGIQNALDRAREEAVVLLVEAESSFGEAYRTAEHEQKRRRPLGAPGLGHVDDE